MDPINLMRLNETYRHKVYAEEILSEEELADITQWVESLVQEGYDLDQFSDEELYTAYLEEAKGEGPEHAKPGTKTYQSVFRGYKPKSPSEKEAMHRGSGSKAKRRADNMEESVDLYDIVSEYLVSEGFCDSHEDADVIMANMSEEWRESIMEEVLDEAKIDKYVDKKLQRSGADKELRAHFKSQRRRQSKQMPLPSWRMRRLAKKLEVPSEEENRAYDRRSWGG
jgi:hypothetical protein